MAGMLSHDGKHNPQCDHLAFRREDESRQAPHESLASPTEHIYTPAVKEPFFANAILKFI